LQAIEGEMAGNKDDDAALALFLIGLLIALAIVVLPFIWASAREELNKPHTSVIVTEGCKEGASCQVCNEKNGNKTCAAGICDAQANCLVPAQKNTALNWSVRGLGAQVK
jgi:hypothetical protein